MSRKRTDLVDVAAEREVLGAVFVRPELLSELTLGVEDFGVSRHRLIWAGIGDCVANGVGVDVAAVAHVMRNAGTFEAAGGVRALSECLDRIGGSRNALYYAGVLRERAIERKMLDKQGELGGAIARNDQEAVSKHLDDLQALSAEHAQMGSKLSLITLAERKKRGEDWLDTEPPEARVLLRCGGKPFMRDGRVALIVAAGSTGKTMALCDLALAISTGSPWLGTYSVEHKGRVCLALGEEDEDEARRRLHKIAKRLNAYERSEAERNIVPLGLAGQEVGFMRKGADGNITATAWFDSFRSSLARNGPWRAIILDPWSRWGGPEAETDAHAATRGVQLLEALAKLPGSPAVIVAHHTRKPQQGARPGADVADTRGSSALVDGARLVLHMTRRWEQSSLLELKVTKANYTVPGNALVLCKGDGGVLGKASAHEVEEDNEARKEARKAKA